MCGYDADQITHVRDADQMALVEDADQMTLSSMRCGEEVAVVVVVAAAVAVVRDTDQMASSSTRRGTTCMAMSSCSMSLVPYGMVSWTTCLLLEQYGQKPL